MRTSSLIAITFTLALATSALAQTYTLPDLGIAYDPLTCDNYAQIKLQAQGDKTNVQNLIDVTLPAANTDLTQAKTDAQNLCGQFGTLFERPQLFLQTGQKNSLRKAKQPSQPVLSHFNSDNFREELAQKVGQTVGSLAEIMTARDGTDPCGELTAALDDLVGFVSFATTGFQTDYIQNLIDPTIAAADAKEIECQPVEEEDNTGGEGGEGGTGGEGNEGGEGGTGGEGNEGGEGGTGGEGNEGGEGGTGGEEEDNSGLECNIITGDLYTIESAIWHKFLGNPRDDNLYGLDVQDVWEVVSEGEGIFSLRSTTTGNYLRAGRGDEVNTISWNRGWEKWRFVNAGNCEWCIQSNQWDYHLKMYKSGLDYKVNNHETCGSHEHFKLTRVNYTSQIYADTLDGNYVITHKNLGKSLSNIRDEEIQGTTLEDVWTIVHEGYGVYSVQSTNTNNYLRMGRRGNEVNAVSHNRGWEKWYIEEIEEGVYCIENKKWGEFIKMHTQGDNFEVNTQTYCGTQEEWHITPAQHTSQLWSDAIQGTFTIKSKSEGAYLGNYRDSLLAGLALPDVWTVTHLGYGYYTLQSATTSNYLSMRRNEVTAVDWSRSWEKWELIPVIDQPGVYCIMNDKWDDFVKMYKSGAEYKVVDQDNCGTKEQFIFESVTHGSLVWSQVLGGSYTIASDKFGDYLANYRGDDLAGWPRADVWAITHLGFGVYHLQSDTTTQYLSMHKNRIETSDNQKKFEEFYILDAGDGKYCIQSIKWGNYLKIESDGDVSIKSICAANEFVRIEPAQHGSLVWENAISGDYTILSQSKNKYLANLDCDHLTGEDTPATWHVHHEGYGIYSLKSATTMNYLRMGKKEINTISWNRSWEKWLLTENDDGTYCLLNQKWDQNVKITQSQGEWVAVQASGCGSGEKLVFTEVTA